ncbi:hypothetical protein [Bordetella flabilis]|uniref:Uncharacterized protein n=1 Tax=Bordetella flabilis TaxID=463014 RepID=A0A193GNA3_9BORD|nr:hypothetical protein [Bordetella flabilis]ANN80849.1 hypothetical protein BAU07_26365 [Bordetella flabilis]
MDSLNLQPYLPQFSAIVLAHLTAMPDEQWEFYRHRGCTVEGTVRALDKSYVIADETRESLLKWAVSEEWGAKIGEVINAPRYKAHTAKIGEIEGQPVFYIDEAGIYIWAKEPESNMTLSFWVTFPAYPLGW